MSLWYHRRLLFISTEKASTVAVYDITNPRKPVWQSSVYPGRHDMTWAELFNERVIADIDPEGMEFIPEDDSPTGGCFDGSEVHCMLQTLPYPHAALLPVPR